MQTVELPSSMYYDPFNESYQDLEFLNSIPYDDIFEIGNTSFSEIILDNNTSNISSTLSTDSIIDFDLYEDNDIDINVLLNENIEIGNETFHNNTAHNICLLDKGENNLRINFKKPRKSKQKSLLPITIRDIDDIINTNDYNNKPHLKNEDLIVGKPGDRIYLSKEENDLLIRDGFTIPTHFPLTKSEERGLKNIRRKIRNKISAKNSRAKKENYVEGLEQRILMCSKENSMLRLKLDETEKEKMNLYQQVRNLQKQLAKYLPHSTKSGTSLMLLFLTFMVILTPMFDPRRLLSSYSISTENNNGKNIFPGRTRMLLQESTELGEPYMITIKPGPPWQIPPKTLAVSLPSNGNKIIPLNNSAKIVNTVPSINIKEF